ncbi:hypothetical protein MAP00_007409 [Monascus purpureus]|nr:hypothetical protein MAP00_007409 [Monascus purpureus]
MAHIGVASKSAALRAELKEWERAFAAANAGKKAGREDIKKDSVIAAKYKEYNRLKSLESSSNQTSNNDNVKSMEPLKLEERSKKRRRTSHSEPGNAHITSTPRKATKDIFATPSRHSRVPNVHPSQLDPYDSPSVLRRLFSPSTHRQDPSPLPLKAAIGPTPQRDGKALGLFDLLSESGGSTATPMAEKLAEHRGAVAQTPSRRKRHMDTIQEEEEEDDDDDSKDERSPAAFSLAKLFATPTTLRYAAMVEDNNTPSLNKTRDSNNCNAKENSTGTETAVESSNETPHFLRRYKATSSNLSSHGLGLSPTAVRKPPSFVGKGLSALVQGLREMEEEHMEEEWNVMKEIEAEQKQQQQEEAENVQVTDSQAPERPWKKKGQKRTTRRVIMRPVLSKPKTPVWNDPNSDFDGGPESDNEPAPIPDTQRPNAPRKAAMKANSQPNEEVDADTTSLNIISEPVSESEPEPDDSDLDQDYVDEPEVDTKNWRPKSFSEKMQEAISSVGDIESKTGPNTKEKARKSQSKQEDEVKKPRARKINPEAHANYRSLKIRNRSHKGRGFGRFRRR